MERPFKMVALDLLALPPTKRGHIGCVVLVDHYTKWVSVVPMKNKRAETVASVIRDWILPTLIKIPESILTDNGPEFIAQSLQDVLDSSGIKHIFTTPYHPSSNGAVERFNRTLVEMMRCSQCSNDEWDVVISTVLLNYNN